MEFFAEARNWVSIAVVLFFVLFGRKLWAALTGMLDGHAEVVRTELAEAARLRREAEAMLADANTRREQAPRRVDGKELARLDGAALHGERDQRLAAGIDRLLR